MLASLSHMVAVGGSSQELGDWHSALGIALVLVVSLLVAVLVIGAIAGRQK